MLDLSNILGFEWDSGNARKSLDKHDVTKEEAEQVFLDPRLLVVADPEHSQSEERFRALGQTADGRMLHITFTLRDHATRIRVISARPMNRNERPHYDKET